MHNITYVGIGASAGGLKAFNELVRTLPKNKNYVYIIAQHLDATKKSALVEILARNTSLKVSFIQEDTHFLPNHIYVIPQGKNLTFLNGKLVLIQATTSEHTAIPSIDEFFKSLAFYKKENAIGIILSGSGKDGTEGIKYIKKYKGITMVQEPTQAHCKSMPTSAIETNDVDYILPVEQISKVLGETLYAKESSSLKTIGEALLREEDFNISKYKEETILRRINKRMILAQTPTLKEYVAYMKQNQDETHLLYQDILIGVTKFFRDKNSFDMLRDEISLYLQNKPENYELKVWSIACSSGEEAYTLAILISQISQKLQKKFNVKIFASDIDEIALKKARAALYSNEDVQEIDTQILKKYFSEVSNGYKVTEEIRKQIVFTKHNIFSDPPFINQDIISCRNLLIYIRPEIQQEIFNLFHYTLKDNGLLFLGSSESTLTSIRYFTPLNSEFKIYTKEKVTNPPKISSNYFSKHLEEKEIKKGIKIEENEKSDIEKQISNLVFDYFSPNCILIDKEFSIVYKKGALPFLKMPDGFITLNVLDNLHKSLQYDVRKALNKAFETKSLQKTQFIEIILNDTKSFVRLIATPYQALENNDMLLLYFQELSSQELQFNTSSLNILDESSIIQNLNTQLSQAKEDNYLLSNELLLNKERMQLLNEELQSSNEELQSSNEELETSNEELQSSNEELHISIVNEMNLQKQLSSILNASQDGIIGLDLAGNHTFVNSAALKTLGFSKDELLHNSAHKIWHHTKKDGSHFPISECTLHSKLVDGVSVRVEDIFWKKDGTFIEVSVLQNPILKEHKVIGSVLSFHDITEKNRLKKEAQHEHELAEMYVNISDTLVMTLDLDGNIRMINHEGAKLLEMSQKELLGKNWFDNFIEEENIDEIKNVFSRVVQGTQDLASHYTNAIVTAKKNRQTISWTNHYTKDIDGNITGIITSGINITKEEELSQRLLEQEKLYKLTFKEADIGIAHLSLGGKWIDANEYLCKLLGYTKNELLAMNTNDITYNEDKSTDKQMIEQLLDDKQSSYHIEKRYVHKDGSIIWVAISVVMLKDEFGQQIYFLKIIRDISQLKLLMYQVEKEKHRLKEIIEFSPIPLIQYSEDGEINFVNRAFHETMGYTREELVSIDNFINLLTHKTERIENYFKNPAPQKDFKHTFLTKNKEKKISILNAVILHDTDDTQRKSYLVAIIDITDLQEKDDLMLAQSRQAAMGEMLAMIAHQWRQPISVISMLANNLRATLELGDELTDENIHDLIQTLNKQTNYLSQTIEDFANFFKPDKEKELVKLSTLLAKVDTLLSLSLKKNGIDFIIPKENELKVSIYFNQLLQVLINIVNNAQDALKTNNTKEPFIKVDILQNTKETTLCICDNGGGIDKSIIKKLGQPYVSTKSKNGTGLGLYMSSKIVTDQLNGRIYWESDDKGSCFFIALPNEE